MCCFFTTLVLLGPRFAAIIWWIFNPARFSAAFNGFLLPILGIIFLPWTLLMYLIVWNPVTGLTGWGWLWIGLALVFDIASYAGGGYGNRNRIPGYSA